MHENMCIYIDKHHNVSCQHGYIWCVAVHPDIQLSTYKKSTTNTRMYMNKDV
jgi:hypothetical protein